MLSDDINGDVVQEFPRIISCGEVRVAERSLRYHDVGDHVGAECFHQACHVACVSD